MDGRQYSLIDVEREDRVLSMLLIKSNILMNWKNICSIILLGLTNESGKWSNDIIGKIESQGAVIISKKHIRKSIQEREKQIYERIV